MWLFLFFTLFFDSFSPSLEGRTQSRCTVLEYDFDEAGYFQDIQITPKGDTVILNFNVDPCLKKSSRI